MLKICFLFIVISVIVSNLTGQTAIEPAIGDGTEINPYQIESIGNLYWIAADEFRWAYHYLQTADINASTTANWHNGAGWLPIGTPGIGGRSFTGSYNGGGHIIDSLLVNRNYSIGLFGKTS